MKTWRTLAEGYQIERLLLLLIPVTKRRSTLLRTGQCGRHGVPPYTEYLVKWKPLNQSMQNVWHFNHERFNPVAVPPLFPLPRALVDSVPTPLNLTPSLADAS